jgi:murein DD-endopeptidase MepM/ murein hydrolase activator NlpD
VAAPLPAPAADTSKVKGLRATLNSLYDKIRHKRDDLETTAQKEQRLSSQLRASQERLEQTHARLKAAEARLKAAENEVAAASKRLQEAHRRVRVQGRMLGRRIARNYSEGTVSYADVLLGAATVADLLDRQVYVEQVMETDRAVLRALRIAQKQVEIERDGLLRRREALTAAKDAIVAQKEAVVAQTKKHAELLAHVQKERVLQEQELDELEQDSMAIEQRLAAEERRRLFLLPGKGLRYRLRWNGKFVAPVQAPISSGFGYRMHPILGRMKLHSGVDFAAPTGTPVVAAAAGEIFTAGWCGGYGRCIIILHGNGISTLYGHLSSILVSEGEYVKRGQVIGLVGSTGFSTGPHLHWEVRKNGAPVNPM